MGLKIISEKFRDDVLLLNLKTPPDVVLGLVDLSGAALLTAYLDSIGKDAIIKTDKASVTLSDPGNVVTDSIAPRAKDLNKNLKTPTDVTQGLGNLTANATLTAQFLSGLGDPTNINDYNVKNPGDVVSDSILPRQKNFNKNINTPPDITNNIGSGYLGGRGLNAVISDFSVINPGTVDDAANIERPKLFNKNIKLNTSDPSSNDPLFSDLSNGSYTYTSLAASIGQMTYLSDLSIPNTTSISILSNQTADVTLNLALQQNLYIPTVLNTFESKIQNLTLNQNKQPYITAYNSGIFSNGNQPQTYTPSEFLNLTTSQSPISILTNVNLNPLEFLLGTGKPVLKDETLLMNIAALELKFNFESRIKRAVERDTIGRTRLDEALTNPSTAISLLKDPRSWFELNYEITVSSNPIGKAAEFIASLAGVTSPISLIRDIREDYTPKCFGNAIDNTSQTSSGFSRFVNDLLGRTARQQPDVYYLNHTGAGQKYQLFSNVKKNKYSPDYLADYQSGVFQLGEKIAQELRSITGFLGLGAGARPTGNFYIGNRNKHEDPAYLMQDGDGDIVKSSEKLIESLKQSNPSGSPYEEPGYDEVSGYGNVQTDFIWKDQYAKDTILNPIKKLSEPVNILNRVRNEDALSYNKYYSNRFRECSILYKTSQLLEKGMNGFGSPIDQTLTKFYDGYSFASRANATISPTKLEVKNKQGEITGYRYLVPGLDASGKRNNEAMYYEAELCRVWTKTRPYSKITDLIRYKELLRRERNSVLDRFGNLNIFPSELNVNRGYGKTDGIGAATTEAFGERRARKYMFSIENLAWRDSELFRDLPDCEKGSNGGRIMWFPPYDIKFTDDTTANWTTHQFLGRPEPIYTYNNTERSGTLGWKIIVDHPSILNLLAQKELARLTDGEVDEILTAFWAGCVEFDIFELARIWNQFSQSDIDYFKKVISGLDLKTPNEQVKTRLVQASVFKQPDDIKADDTNSTVPTFPYDGYGLFFENDVPLRRDFNKKFDPLYDQGIIQPFDAYFEKYKSLVNGGYSNVEAVKNQYGAAGGGTPTDFNYKSTLDLTDKYFYDTSKNEKWYGFEKQYKAIAQEIGDAKYKQFDLTITISAFASPLNTNVKQYNDDLANRRFESAVKWMLTKNILSRSGKLYKTKDGSEEITDANVADLFAGNPAQISVYRDKIDNDPNSKDKAKITFNLVKAKGLTSKEIFEGNGIITNFKKLPTGEKYFEISAVDKTTNEQATYYCFADAKTADEVIKGNLFPNPASPGTFIGANRISSLELDGSVRSYEDIVCSVGSIVASYARRVEVSVVVNAPAPKPPKVNIPPEPVYITVPGDANLSATNVTKRDIAQRILNRFITECDYFELLKSDAPILFDSLKQKLKYFTPAFHSMTPEGLNARLTFLQQCMRPGETIKRGETATSCDASNTAFGKPPVCILRIGDFYNTKIVINNLNITYDPLLWDLNPEGIGVQPMLANIQLSFKYIGGSGLRKYVDELQNALTFNYYANADVYDSRTFANTDLTERNLVNLERSFFDNNTLDLIPIVARAEQFVSNTFQSDIPYGTVGVITSRRTPTTAGGAYGSDILTAKTYEGTKIYQPYEIVTNNDKFFLRKADDLANIASGNSFDGTKAAITDTKYWEEIKWRNYGEQPFRLEFGKVRATGVDASGNPTGTTTSNDQATGTLDNTYFNWYEIQYLDIFKELYGTYGKIIETNFALNNPYYDSNNTKKVPSSLLFQLVLNKNYNKQLTITNTTNITLPATSGTSGTLGTASTASTSSTSGISGTLGTSSTSTNPNTTYLDDVLNDLEDFGVQTAQIGSFSTSSTSGTSSSSSTSGTNGTSASGKFYLYDVFDSEAAERNYVEFKNFSNLAKVYSEEMGSIKISPLKLHLYPQKYLFKIGDGTTLVTNTGSFDDTTRFNPGDLTGGNYGSGSNAEVSGIYLKDYSHYQTNINGLIGALTQEMEAKLRLDVAMFWQYDAKAKEVYKNYLTYFESQHKDILISALVTKLRNYSSNLQNQYDTILGSATENTAKFGTLLSGLSVIADGYEIRKTEDGKSEYFEVMPNEYKLNSDPKTLFGYDPYHQYQTLSFNTFSKITLKEVRTYINDKENDDANKLKFLSLGNGAYFFKQISDDPIVTGVSSQNFTLKNELMKSRAINNNLDVPYASSTPNFEVKGTGVTLNTVYDKIGKPGYTTVKDVTPPTGSTESAGTYAEYYTMTYTFEKINYELFDFTNKTLDIMINDNFMKKDFDMDIIFENDLDFYYQVSELTKDKNNTNETSALSLFYYGTERRASVNTPITYYKLNYGSVSGTTTDAAVKNINNKLEYKVKILKELVNSLNPSLSSLIGKEIRLSGLLDIIFTDFFMTIDDTDKANILTQLNSVDPVIGISTDPKTRVKNIEARKKKIESTLNSIFTAINTFRDGSQEMMQPIIDLYTTNYGDVNTAMWKVISGKDGSFNPTSNIIQSTLVKGGESDYTLVFKDTVNTNVKKSAINNYNVFTNNRLMFNIITQSENKESVEQNTTTQLSQYLKGE
jgi:hypothetical protein